MKVINAKRFVTLSLDKLVKADWNYKQDDAETLEKLVANLKRNGQVENIIVRELDTGFYEIVNGNHRFDALKIVGAKEAVAYNLGKISLAAAKRLAVETNETKFASNTNLLDELLRELSESFDPDDLMATVPEFLYQGGDVSIESPEEFPEQDESIKVDYCCPKCGFKWSGGERVRSKE